MNEMTDSKSMSLSCLCDRMFFSDVDCEYTFVVECKQFNNIHTKPFSCNKQSHTLNVKINVSQPKNRNLYQ